jgi:hypothetical protein
VSDFRVQCWTLYHLKYSLGITIPSLLIWIITFNLGVLSKIRQSLEKLSEESIIKHYGLFYVGLRDNAAPYWEVVISMARKIIFIGMSTYITSSTSNHIKVRDDSKSSLGYLSYYHNIGSSKAYRSSTTIY